MSITGIASTAFAHLANVQHNYQKVQSEFKQLGQDLQSGNLAQAQADFVVLSQSLATNQQTGSVNSAGPSPSTPPNFVAPNAVTQPAQNDPTSASHHKLHFRQALSQLGQALQAGDLSAAQQAFATMESIWQHFGSSVASAVTRQPAAVNVSA